MHIIYYENPLKAFFFLLFLLKAILLFYFIYRANLCCSFIHIHIAHTYTHLWKYTHSLYHSLSPTLSLCFKCTSSHLMDICAPTISLLAINFYLCFWNCIRKKKIIKTITITTSIAIATNATTSSLSFAYTPYLILHTHKHKRFKT